MNKITVSFPEKYLFSTQIQVTVGDINYGRHLSNDAVLRLTHESRIRFLNSLGYSEFDTAGSSLIMADAVIRYLNQSQHKDILTFYITVGDISKCSFALYTKIKRENDDIAHVRNTLIFFNYELKKVNRTPLEFIEKIGNLPKKEWI